MEFDAEGIEARVIQHEIDHLDGVLIVDRVEGEERTQRAFASFASRPEPRPVRVAFFGTAEFGADVLRALVGAASSTLRRWSASPTGRPGRGRRPQPPPVAAAAAELGLPLLQPERASETPPPADAGIVVAFGQLIRRRCSTPTRWSTCTRHGCRAGAARPRWSGRSWPVTRDTGVAVIELVASWTPGPCGRWSAIGIGPEDDAGAVRRRALELGVPLLEQALLEPSRPVPQSGEVPTPTS